MKKNLRHGYTLVEIMVVVLILGILLSVALPNFRRPQATGRARTCQGNLEQIQSAKEQWAMTTHAAKSATPASDDLYGPELYIKHAPQCPARGVYSIGEVGSDPTCSVSQNGTPETSDDHVLQ